MALLDPIGCGMWSLTPYDKCDLRCVYCCTRVQGTSKPAVPVAELLPVLRQRLDGVPQEELVIVGAFCDAYPSLEDELCITRPVLEELGRRGRKFVVVTKATTVERDLDVLLRHRDLCKVQISVSSVDDDVLRRLDPGAPSGTARLAVLWRLYDAGIEVNLNALPWIPDITETEALIDRVPADVEIIFAPLAVGVDRDCMTLLGRRYTREEVNRRYLAEYRRYGHVPNTSWVRPSPPPEENNPMFRLPVLQA